MLVRPQGIKQNERKKRLINQIFLPLDGSDLSKLALPIGEELADKLNVSITLFQMAIKVQAFDMVESNAYTDYSKLNEDKEKWVRADMIALEKELREKGLNVNYVVTLGFDAGNEIIEVGKKVDADLVIMSLLMGGLACNRWAFGSVARKSPALWRYALTISKRKSKLSDFP